MTDFSKLIEKLQLSSMKIFSLLIVLILLCIIFIIIFHKKIGKIATLLLLCLASGFFSYWLFYTTVYYLPVTKAKTDYKNGDMAEISGVVTKIESGKTITFIYIDDEKYLFATEMICDMKKDMTVEIVYTSNSKFIVAYWIAYTN